MTANNLQLRQIPEYTKTAAQDVIIQIFKRFKNNYSNVKF